MMILFIRCHKDKQSQCEEYLIDTIHLTAEQKSIIPYTVGSTILLTSSMNDSLKFVFTYQRTGHYTDYEYGNGFQGRSLPLLCRGPYYVTEDYEISNNNKAVIDIAISNFSPFSGEKNYNFNFIGFSIAFALDSNRSNLDFFSEFLYTLDSLYIYDRSGGGKPVIYNFSSTLKLGNKTYNNVYELGWEAWPEPMAIQSIYFSIKSGILGLKKKDGTIYYLI